MAAGIDGMRVAFVVANEGVEEVELTEPWKAIEQAGGLPELLAPERGEVQAFNHFDPGDTFPVDRLVSEAEPEDYDALVLPGGVGNADEIRADKHAVRFVRHFVETDKPIAVICHGPWILIEAGGLQGRVLTSWPSLHDRRHQRRRRVGRRGGAGRRELDQQSQARRPAHVLPDVPAGVRPPPAGEVLDLRPVRSARRRGGTGPAGDRARHRSR